jgi:hypothetical protein
MTEKGKDLWSVWGRLMLTAFISICGTSAVFIWRASETVAVLNAFMVESKADRAALHSDLKDHESQQIAADKEMVTNVSEIKTDVKWLVRERKSAGPLTQGDRE